MIQGIQNAMMKRIKSDMVGKKENTAQIQVNFPIGSAQENKRNSELPILDNAL